MFNSDRRGRPDGARRTVTVWSPTRDWVDDTVAAAVGTGLLLAFVSPRSASYPIAPLIFIALLAAVALAREKFRSAEHLPFVGGVAFIVGPLLAVAPVAVVVLTTGEMPGLRMLELLATAGVMAIILRLGRAGAPGSRGRGRPVRLAVVGSADAAAKLVRELQVTGFSRYRVIGTISPGQPVGPARAQEQAEAPDLHLPHLPGGVELGAGSAASEHVAELGSVGSLIDVVTANELDLLLVTHDFLEPEIFDGIACSSARTPVRVSSLSEFCERVFGHVPISEIDGSWFRYLMHPEFRVAEPVVKRALDLFVGILLGLAILPLMIALVLLIRRDGGPALFKQLRIGEAGRTFTLYKLRTMHTNSEPVWAAQHDPRITRLGHLLRRTHLDELPQLLNVIRGEMTLVGPRPEQPGFVQRLEELLPFYSPRHSIKPGLTGWAQVRGGYAGSGFGSAQKLCYDLYYLKHRSLVLDLVVLAETLRMFILHRQYPEDASVPSLLLDHHFREMPVSSPGGAVPLRSGGRIARPAARSALIELAGPR